jgi:hypothetical protein
MSRQSPYQITAKDLETASKAFRYEMRMLRHMAARLPRAKDAVDLNAYIESFLIHARSVVKFMYGPRQRSRDALAADFFANPERWIASRGPEPSGTLDDDRVGREIAHITYARTWDKPADKAWDIPAILAELDRLEDAFFDLQPEHWVGPRSERTGAAITAATAMANSSGVAFDPMVYGPNLLGTRSVFPDDAWDVVVRPPDEQGPMR